MPRRRLQNFFANTTSPFNLALPPYSETHSDGDRQGEPEETAQENTYEDRQTNMALSKQNIQSDIFYLPIDYKVFEILGRGAFGVVAAATTTSADRRIAIKQIKLDLEPSHNDEKNLYRWKSVCRELSLLRQLSERGGHPNVIVLEDVFFVSMANQHEIMFLTNLMETSLDTLMKSRPLTSGEKQRYIYQIFCGLHYLHSNNIIHRDLKSANVLVNGDKLCIADLGQARVGETVLDEISLTICDNTTASQPLTNHGVGTFIYRALELHFKCPHYSCSVDQWSAGCIFGEMFLEPNKTLFTGGEQGDNIFALIDEIFHLIGTPTSPEDIEWLPAQSAIFIRRLCSRQALESEWSKLSIADETALDLLKNLLEFNPSRRITAGDALQHNYFSNTDLPNSQVVLLFSSSLFTSIVELDQLTTTQEIREVIYNEIKRMKQTD